MDMSLSELWAPQMPPAHAYLVMPGSVTSLPALMAALKQCAPWVSMAIMGTCCQPTSARPADTPARRPPPPTATTRAPGGVPSAAFSSRTRLTWPSLWDEGVGEVAGLRAGPVHKAHRDTAPHSASPRPVHSRGRGDPYRCAGCTLCNCGSPEGFVEHQDLDEPLRTIRFLCFITTIRLRVGRPSRQEELDSPLWSHLWMNWLGAYRFLDHIGKSSNTIPTPSSLSGEWVGVEIQEDLKIPSFSSWLSLSGQPRMFPSSRLELLAASVSSPLGQ